MDTGRERERVMDINVKSRFLAGKHLRYEDSSGVTGTSLVIDGGHLAAAEWQHPGRTRFMKTL